MLELSVGRPIFSSYFWTVQDLIYVRKPNAEDYRDGEAGEYSEGEEEEEEEEDIAW